MKVAVTGASGFIGRHVVHALLAKNVEVIATATRIEHLQSFAWVNNVTAVAFDIHHSSNNPFHDLHQPDILIHCAWSGLPNYKQPFHLEKELPAQKKFLQAIIQGGCKQLTVTGTCMEYGMQEGCLQETQTIYPETSYALAKNDLRLFLESIQLDNNFSMNWLRLFYTYGEGQNKNSILAALQQALDQKETRFNMSLGDQQRDYLPVEEVARSIVACATQTHVQGIINISSGTAIPIVDLVKNYLNTTKQNISLNLGFYPKPDYEPHAFWGDNSKLKKITT